MSFRRFKPSVFLINVGLFIIVGCVFTYELIRALLADRWYMSAVFLGGAMITAGAVLSRRKATYGRKKMLPWILVGVLSLVRNAELRHGTYNTELLFLLYLWIAIVLSGISGWQDKLKKYTVMWGSLHVAAPIIFFIFRGSYAVMVNLWGRYPTGTNKGLTGYCAGITTHYSQNATYIVILFLVLACTYIVKPKKMRTKREAFAIAITLVALMLTAKRAHLCFGVLAVVFVYYLVNPEKRGNKLFKVIAAMGGAVTILAVMYEIMPEVFQTVLGRFVDGGYGDITSGRIPMWMLAVDLFKGSPIFGIGWSGYRYSYALNLFSGYAGRSEFLNTHNVYLQLLCEVGIVGTLIVTGALYSFMRNALILNKHCEVNDSGKRINIAVSVGMGVFFIFYSVTGCCLYDLTFHMFILIAAMIMPYRKMR